MVAAHHPDFTTPVPLDDALLSIRGLGKTFPGVRALHEVDFTLRRGEIHALMGENGAGKSTLIKVLTGVYGRDAGTALLDGQPIHPRSPNEAQALGISTVYQEVNLVGYLSVAENMYLGREPMRGGRFGKVRWSVAKRGARAALKRLDVNIDVARPVGSYPIAIQQLVAIARAADVDAKVLILDEPTSSLSGGEIERLFTVMRRLRDDGLGLVFVTHFLDQVYAVCDRITVLRNGGLVGEYPAADLSRLELVAKMIGKDLDAVRELSARHGAAETNVSQGVLLEAKGLSRGRAVAGVDLTVRAGEVVGLAGLLGSGRTETAKLLFGIDRRDAGTIAIKGAAPSTTAPASPREAMRLGLAFAPEERKTEAILPDLSVRQNIVLSLQARRGWLRKLSRRRQGALASEYIAAMNIRTPDAEKPIGQLSGGNQQKAILARWLASEPKVFIVDEPTRGIDVGAKAEIEKLVARLTAEGMGVVFISSEIDETVRNCHRVVVLRDGHPVAELAGTAIDADAIMQAIAGDPTTPTTSTTPTTTPAPTP